MFDIILSDFDRKVYKRRMHASFLERYYENLPDIFMAALLIFPPHCIKWNWDFYLDLMVNVFETIHQRT